MNALLNSGYLSAFRTFFVDKIRSRACEIIIGSNTFFFHFCTFFYCSFSAKRLSRLTTLQPWTLHSGSVFINANHFAYLSFFLGRSAWGSLSHCLTETNFDLLFGFSLIYLAICIFGFRLIVCTAVVFSPLYLLINSALKFRALFWNHLLAYHHKVIDIFA